LPWLYLFRLLFSDYEKSFDGRSYAWRNGQFFWLELLRLVQKSNFKFPSIGLTYETLQYLYGEIPDRALKIDYAAIRSTLQAFFDKVIKQTSFSDCWVQWCSAPPGAIQPNELLVYFVRSSRSTLTPGFGFSGTLGFDGTTTWKTGGGEALSEVYVSRFRDDPKTLAALAFHELMHNKLRLGKSLHGKGGLANEEVTAATSLTESNIKLIVGKLAAKAPQWIGSWKYASDPLSGYF
jgi:hypothetical protein